MGGCSPCVGYRVEISPAEMKWPIVAILKRQNFRDQWRNKFSFNAKQKDVRRQSPLQSGRLVCCWGTRRGSAAKNPCKLNFDIQFCVVLMEHLQIKGVLQCTVRPPTNRQERHSFDFSRSSFIPSLHKVQRPDCVLFCAVSAGQNERIVVANLLPSWEN